MSDTTEKTLSTVRQRIQDSLDIAEETRKKRLQNIRIDIAKSGINLFADKKITEAVKQFHLYLRILEDLKGVPEHGLMPSHFDPKKDISELLLISGVYWDMAKLYDRTRSSEKVNDFKVYLQKFVVFSRGMPYQPVCAETLRKYLATQKPLHRDAFQGAYKQLADGKCFIATELMDYTHPDTPWKLRTYRDETLRTVFWGRVFIRIYYGLGRFNVFWVKRLPVSIKKHIANVLDRLV